MWTHPEQLPDWAFKQQEINGNKNPAEKSATWFVDEIVSEALEDDREDEKKTCQSSQVNELFQEICRSAASHVAAQCGIDCVPSLRKQSDQLAIPP